jgi:thiol-disulfide isomerase/thioredoxin
MQRGPVLYYIYMEGCGACDQAKPHLARWEKKNPGVLKVHRVNLLEAKWTHPWQPDVTPTYVLEVPGYQRVQHQGVLTEAEIPKFLMKAQQMMRGVR